MKKGQRLGKATNVLAEKQFTLRIGGMPTTLNGCGFRRIPDIEAFRVEVVPHDEPEPQTMRRTGTDDRDQVPERQKRLSRTCQNAVTTGRVLAKLAPPEVANESTGSRTGETPQPITAQQESDDEEADGEGFTLPLEYCREQSGTLP